MEMVDWNWDKYGTPRFYPKQFFSLSEDKINQSIYYSGTDIGISNSHAFLLLIEILK
jgi:hypothetical protein